MNKHHLLLHFIVFIWGWSPILGKLISVEAFRLVWFRIFFTVIALSIYFFSTHVSLRLDKKTLLKLLGIGAVIAVHWCCFYSAIKISNVSVTLVAFSTASFFTSIVEPIFYKRKIIVYEVLFGLLIIGAIALIFSIEAHYWWGFLLGAIAALTSSLFTVWNGLLVRRTPSELITFYELSGGLFFLSLYLLSTGAFSASFFIISASDFFYLGILSIVGTAFTFIASTRLLKNLSPFTITLAVNLETVYGIIFAFCIWPNSEKMTFSFYVGTLLILGVIILNAVVKTRLKKEEGL
ncbi:MAG: DMT family transporter [Bacteroidetes bacterium]|nr:DMT family transporter [Bacteroidota bacterium]